MDCGRRGLCWVLHCCSAAIYYMSFDPALPEPFNRPDHQPSGSCSASAMQVPCRCRVPAECMLCEAGPTAVELV